MIVSFWDGLFSGAFAVSFREGTSFYGHVSFLGCFFDKFRHEGWKQILTLNTPPFLPSQKM